MIALPNDSSNPLQVMTSANQSQSPVVPMPASASAPASPPAAPPAPPPDGQDALSNLPMTSPNPQLRPNSFGDKLANALSNAKPIPVRGGALASIAGAGVDALSGIGKSLGDISSTPVTPGGSGILEGISQTLANRNNRLNAQAEQAAKAKQQQFENDQTSNRNKVLNAYTTAETVSTQRAVARADSEFQDQHIARGKSVVKDMEAAGHDFIADGITEDQLRAGGIGPGQKYDHDKVSGYQTGTQMVEKNGTYVEEPTFTLVARKGGPVTPSDENADFISKYTSQDVPHNTPMDHDHYDALMSAAQSAAATANLINAQNRKIGAEELSDKQIKEKADDLRAVGPIVGHYGDELTGIEVAAKQVDPKTKQPTPVAQSAIRLLQGYSQEQLEKYRSDVVDEQEKAAEEKTKKDAKESFLGDQSSAQNPKAFLASLSPTEQNIVREAGESQMALDRLDYLAARNPNFLEAVATAYPNFRSDLVKDFLANSKDFTSGKVGAALKSGSTALEHLRRFYDNTDYVESRIPGTQSNKQRETDFNNLALELAKFSNGGTAPTKEEISDAKNSLGGDQFYSANRKKAIKEQVRLMQDSLNDYQTKWDNAIPAPQYRTQMPNISPQARQASAYILNGGQAVQPIYAAAPGKPRMMSTDGGKTWQTAQ